MRKNNKQNLKNNNVRGEKRKTNVANYMREKSKEKTCGQKQLRRRTRDRGSNTRKKKMKDSEIHDKEK